MNTGIYKIENVINGHCYIGQSVRLNRRKWTHFNELENNKHSNNHLQNAYKKYGKKNFVFGVLLYCESFELTRYEQGLVDRINPKYNICRECVDSCKGIKHSKETKQKMSLAQKQSDLCKEHLNKIQLAKKGTKLSEEQKQKISLANTGYKHTEEAKRNMSLGKTGHTTSFETKQKISMAHIGIKPTEETKLKMSLSRTGKKRSEETKQKMSLAQKERRRWEKRRENK